MINLKERMSKIHEEQVQELKVQNHRSEEAFNVERNSWDLIFGSKEEEKDKLKKDF